MNPHSTDLKSERADLRPEKSASKPKGGLGSQMRPKIVDLKLQRAERAYFRSERADLRPDRVDFRSVRS